VGRDALLRVKEQGIRERLIGFRLLERGFPRPGYEVRQDGRAVGKVTSGTLSPSLGVGIGLAYLPVEIASPGGSVEIVIRGQALQAELARPPFYTGGSLQR